MRGRKGCIGRYTALVCVASATLHLSWTASVDIAAVMLAAQPAAAARRRAEVIVTDVDGTLMNSQHELPVENRQALRSCLQRGIPVVLATGKHRGPWVDALVSSVTDSRLPAESAWTLNAPGVFVQGLLICNKGGQVVQRSVLPPHVIRGCAEEARRKNLTLLAYTDDDRIISNRFDEQHARINALKEPTVEVGDVEAAVSYKMLFLAAPEDEAAVRKTVAAAVGGEAAIAVAIPGMVEVLPPGASKADGVKVALGLLGRGPQDVLALGDGENDIEFLQYIRQGGGITAAVANARPALKAVAEESVASCDDSGWAEAVERWVLQPQRA